MGWQQGSLLGYGTVERTDDGPDEDSRTNSSQQDRPNLT